MRRRWLALLPIMLAATASAQSDSPGDRLRALRAERRALADAAPPESMSASLAADVAREIAWLADPARGGRAPGTPGIDDAAAFIEDAFLGIGLEPAFAAAPNAADGSAARTSYRRSFAAGRTDEAWQARFSVALPDGRIVTAADDIEVSVYSGTNTFSGPCVFAGYGIVTGGDGYLGFKGDEDFTGDAVLILTAEPNDDTGHSLWTTRGWSFAAPLHRKINAVVRRGASAVLVVDPPDVHNDPTDPMFRPQAEVDRFAVPVVHIPADVADRMLRAGDAEGRGLEALCDVANHRGVVIELAGETLALQVAVQGRDIRTDNIGAVLPGRGPLADEYVVIGAHYDHIGLGQAGALDRSGVIHPGADDNASGTAAMLAAADIITRRLDALPPDRPARSVLFLAFSGEEKGLLGSKDYLEHPIAPLDDHVLMINLDMVGHLGSNGLQVRGVGAGDPLSAFVDPIIEASGLPLAPPDPALIGRSDDAGFRDHGVSAMGLSTGLSPAYHTAMDTADQVDEDGVAAIAQLAAELGFTAAIAPDRAALLQGSGTGESAESTADDEPKRVRVGLVPAASSAGAGMLVAQVTPGTCAAEAGLEPGDRITRWNGTPISSMQDWAPLLAGARPGDRVQVEYVRGGRAHTAEIELRGEEE